jgi:hypothetical protein
MDSQVISEVQDPHDPRSGPLLQMLYAIQNVSHVPIRFVNGTFYEHLVTRMCAVNLLVPLTTLNDLLPYQPLLKRLYEPFTSQCSLPTRRLLPLPPLTHYVMRTKLDWEGKWANTEGDRLKLLLSPCEPYYECPSI